MPEDLIVQHRGARVLQLMVDYFVADFILAGKRPVGVGAETRFKELQQYWVPLTQQSMVAHNLIHDIAYSGIVQGWKRRTGRGWL